jgi:hypothetical protein
MLLRVPLPAKPRGPGLVLTAFCSAAMLAACGGGDDNKPTRAELASACTKLNNQAIGGATVTSATRIEPDAVAGDPGYCQVKATRAPYLDLEVDLPDDWSGRFYQQGGGGFDGSIPPVVDATLGLHRAVKTYRAVYAASNGGNRANVPAEAAPSVWTTNSASARDYAYQAVGTTLQFGKAVTAAYYGKAPTRSYFNGCSNGGRNAYIAAQRWPTEYDGIVSGCETMDMTGQTISWVRMGKLAGSSAMPSNAQWTAAYTAAVAACDALDGVTDSVIAHYSACSLDPSTLVCGQPQASTDPAICLTPAQAETVRAAVSDIKLADGTTVYSKFSWSNFGSGLGPNIQWILGGGFSQLATGDSAWFAPGNAPGSRQATFDVDEDYYTIGYGLQGIGADHDRNGIAAYVASGRKLISWHASADEGLSVNDHARNYTNMVQLAGTTANSKFFVVPGASHGVGARLPEVDWLGAIVAWVESGTAPVQLTFNRLEEAEIVRTIPVCEHPKYPRYNGTGDVNLAANYTCTAP